MTVLRSADASGGSSTSPDGIRFRPSQTVCLTTCPEAVDAAADGLLALVSAHTTMATSREAVATGASRVCPSVRQRKGRSSPLCLKKL